jgi:hypothetical protein
MHAKWDAGVPLLQDEGWLPDDRVVRRRWNGVLDIWGRNGHPFAPKLRTFLRDGVTTASLTQAILAGQSAELADTARQRGFDPAMLLTLLGCSLLPSMARMARKLLSEVRIPGDLQIEWDAPVCPMCGAGAVFAEWDGATPTMHLLCSLCASRWPVPSGQCTFCESETPPQYFHLPNQVSLQRGQGCRECGSYRKIIVTSKPMTLGEILAKQLTTLPLDLCAEQAGFQHN